MTTPAPLMSDDTQDVSTFEACPPECDVFTLNPTKIDALLKRGTDAQIVTVRVYRHENGRKVRLGGQWPAAEISTNRVLGEWGPGKYEFHGLNCRAQYLAGSTLDLEDPNAEPEEFEDEEEEILGPPPPPPMPPGMDPTMAFMMQMQAQQQAMFMQMFAQMAKPQQAPAGHNGMEVLAQSIAASTAANTQALQGVTNIAAANMATMSASPQGQANGVLEAITLKLLDAKGEGGGNDKSMEMLMAFAAMKDDKDDGKVFWETIFPTMIDGLGPAFMATAAAAIGGEKGQMVSEMLKAHLEARAAEANADAATATGPTTYETTGEAAAQ